MTEPLVCCVMLTKDRPEMAARAVRSFERQTYQRKRLVIFDTGSGQITRHRGHFQHCELGGSRLSIGELRNKANALADDGSIVIHWDDDDISHPNRIAEQVALLQASGADAVGYNEMLFWRNLPSVADTYSETAYRSTVGPVKAEAWLYSNAIDKRYCLGTSLCYWRKTWEAKPFPDLPKKGGTGEDTAWCKGLNTVGVSALGGVEYELGAPRMIATIHGGNTMPYKMQTDEWHRAPEWDARVREIMEAA